MKETKLAQVDKVSCKWFMAMHSEKKPMTEHMTIEKCTYYYDGMKITDKCTFPEGSNSILCVRTLVGIGSPII
jgi:hypothetical protein